MAAIIMVDDGHIVFQNSNTMTGLTDIVYICLEHTLIMLRNNLCIPIETQIRTHIGRILILLSQQIQY